MSFLRACSLSDLAEDVPRRVELNGVAVSVVRTDEGVFAVNDTCSHANVSLSEGEVYDNTIECWLHGSCFDLRTGEPTALPALRPIPVYPVILDSDDVLVDVTTTISAGDAAATKEL